ncbi:MAG: hypothetical protein Q7J54_07625 [Candidatus Woesearchaeota archaeon]|nr:hypothetical protein [Candidatus Woesearchaeota archaeon]
MTETGIKIELAKSWFIMAQLTMILAGFLFATGGVAWTNSLNSLNFGFNLISDVCQNLNKSAIPTASYADLVPNLVTSQIELARFCILFGVIMTIISLLFFIIGQTQLRNSDK